MLYGFLSNILVQLGVKLNEISIIQNLIIYIPPQAQPTTNDEEKSLRDSDKDITKFYDDKVFSE